MYLAGLTAREISDRCNSNLSTVHRHLRTRESYEPGFLIKHREAIERRHQDTPTTQWRLRCDELAQFMIREGHLPTQDGSASERSLRLWLQRQRRSYSRGKMSPSKIALLQKIDGWITEPFKMEMEEKWKDSFLRLCLYVADHGEYPRYHEYASEDERQLGVWLHTQTQRRAQGSLVQARQIIMDQQFPGWKSHW